MTENKNGEYTDEYGTVEWYLNGELHREDGPAVEHADGSKEWYLNGECHREDGPAIEWEDGTKFWWLNDKQHREDGPAVEYADGTDGTVRTVEWWLNGEQVDISDVLSDTEAMWWVLKNGSAN